MSVLDQDAPALDREPTDEELYALKIEPDVVWVEDHEEDYQPDSNGWTDYPDYPDTGDEEDWEDTINYQLCQ